MPFHALAAASLLLTAAAPATSSAYALESSVPLGAPDRWDYVTYDHGSDRVYVAHGDRLSVVDASRGKLVGQVQGVAGGTHGIVIVPAAGRGFTDDGRAGKVVVFDLKSLRIISSIPVKVDADALALDRASGHLFVVEGEQKQIDVIDTKSGKHITTIDAGAGLEFAVADGYGAIFVAGESTGELLKVDVRSNRITRRWRTSGCASPHGVAVDPDTHRAFMGCANKVMMVVDTVNGHTVATLPIGAGSDAIAFDPVRKRVFSSNGADGSISVYRQFSADRYVALPTIPTSISARTMTLDPNTGRLFVAGAETEPSSDLAVRPRIKPGTLRLMIFAPRA